MTVRPPAGFQFEGAWTGPLVATAIHAGSALRPEIVDAMVLPAADRVREEDPFTDRFIAGLPDRVVVHTSRFEADLNRPRDRAVYRRPADCWGLDVWRGGHLDEGLVAGGRRHYDAFYTALAGRLDAIAGRGPFVVYDVHSYNHRRGGPDAEPDAALANPGVNLGVGIGPSALAPRFRPVADAFTSALRAAVPEDNLDVRENVKFTGGQLSRWVHERYPGVGCALAIEFKKTFMDEWTGVPDDVRIAELTAALAATAEPVVAALRATG